MKKPIEIVLAVADMDGRLGTVGDKLRMLLPADCPCELKESIRQHKDALIDLLRLTFLIVRSDVSSGPIFWTPDELTKDSLVAAGADRGSIYSAPELEVIVHHRITIGELPLFHDAKKRFSGKLTSL